MKANLCFRRHIYKICKCQNSFIGKDIRTFFRLFIIFQILFTRYEKRPIILTTNQPLSKWGDVFVDYTLANAIIDRLVHHPQIIKITGQSYCIKGKLLYDEEGDVGNR